jgi:hypothetical protein
MPKAAAKRFYDRQVPLSVERVLRKLSREARTEFPELQDVEFVDGQPVKGLRITPELREALIQNGLPSATAAWCRTSGWEGRFTRIQMVRTTQKYSNLSFRGQAYFSFRR